MNGSVPAVLSVSELNRRARGCLEREFPLCWVAGEVSNLTRASSGHVYFSLKDDAAQVRCAMFRQRAQLLSWKIDNGDQVEVSARVSLYEARGEFQITVEAIRRAGIGRLYEAFARLKQALDDEGLFAATRKRPFARYPQCIGIVSSLGAAALQDVLAALARRAPHVPLIVYPTPVQGAEAPAGVVAALAAANRHQACAVLLLVRGGGSLEDLWAFNTEPVARAIAASGIPIVSGIGHETDVSIADFVADQRAATPTAAAELVTTAWFAATLDVLRLGARLQRASEQVLNTLRQRVDMAAARLLHPATRITRAQEHLTHLQQRLRAAVHAHLARTHHRLAASELRLQRQRPDIAQLRQALTQHMQRLRWAMRTLLQAQRARLGASGQALHHLNPAHTVARGYAIVRSPDGTLVSAAQQISPQGEFLVELASGQLHGRRLP